MCDTDKVRKYSGSPYVEPEFIELYSFSENTDSKILRMGKEAVYTDSKNLGCKTKYFLDCKILFSYQIFVYDKFIGRIFELCKRT